MSQPIPPGHFLASERICLIGKGFGCSLHRETWRVRQRALAAYFGRASPAYEESVSGTADGSQPSVQHVRVDHGSAYVPVPQQLLHGADVVPVFEQMRGEGVTQGVAGGAASRRYHRGGIEVGGGPLHPRTAEAVVCRRPAPAIRATPTA